MLAIINALADNLEALIFGLGENLDFFSSYLFF